MAVPVYAVNINVALDEGENYDFETNNITFEELARNDITCLIDKDPAGNNWQMQTLNGARRALPGNWTQGNSLFGQNSQKHADAVGFLWTYNFFFVQSRNFVPGGNGSIDMIATSEYNYVRFNGSTTGINNICQFSWDNETDFSVSPFFPQGGTDFNGSRVHTFNNNETFDLYFDYYDLGMMFDITRSANQSFNPIGMDVFYETVDNIVSLLNDTEHFFLGNCFPGTPSDDLCNTPGFTSSGDPRILTTEFMAGQCQLISNSGAGFDNTITNLNVPIGVHQYCAFNDAKNNGTLRIDGAFAMNASIKAAQNTTLRNITWNIAHYDNGTNIITNVRVVQDPPQANENVTIRFESTFLTNASVFFRSTPVPVNETLLNQSLFASVFDNFSTSLHAVDINGSEILLDRFYQFFVVSGNTINNNSDEFYNFTIGGIDAFAGNDSAIVPVTIERLSRVVGVGFSDITYAFGMLLLITTTIISMMAGGMKLGMAVFGSELTIFSIIGLLPQLLIIPIIFIAALGVAFAIKKVMG